jgi:tRNA(Ile2) C34 agmatinyltransferase TiaS
VLNQRTIILIAYRQRDPAEAEWFERAAVHFNVQKEEMRPHWQEMITFQNVAGGSSGAGNNAASATQLPVNTGERAAPSASAPLITASLKYQNEHRPLSIFKLQKKKAVAVSIHHYDKDSLG